MNNPNRDKDSALYKIRHSSAHVMAQAVREMFPDAQIAIGPPIEDGFYYDFDLPRSLTPEDLEDRSRNACARSSPANHPSRSRCSPPKRPASSSLTRSTSSSSSTAWKGRLRRVRRAAGRETRDLDLHPGHVHRPVPRARMSSDTGQINPSALKLMNVAGAYWRGDEHNPMLQRIYGTAWQTARRA